MSELKRHYVPGDVETVDWCLDITRAVVRPLSLARDALESFSFERFGENFVCEEGWVAEGLTLRGIHVRTILDRARPAEFATYGLVHAMDGQYSCGFPIERLREAVLGIELDGEALGPVHGGPARLVPTDTDRDCWETVK